MTDLSLQCRRLIILPSNWSHHPLPLYSPKMKLPSEQTGRRLVGRKEEESWCMPLLTVAMTTAACRQHSFGEWPAPKALVQLTKETQPSVSLGLRSVHELKGKTPKFLPAKVFVVVLCRRNNEEKSWQLQKHQLIVTQTLRAEERLQIWEGYFHARSGNIKYWSVCRVLLRCKNICSFVELTTWPNKDKTKAPIHNWSSKQNTSLINTQINSTAAFLKKRIIQWTKSTTTKTNKLKFWKSIFKLLYLKVKVGLHEN